MPARICRPCQVFLAQAFEQAVLVADRNLSEYSEIHGVAVLKRNFQSLNLLDVLKGRCFCWFCYRLSIILNLDIECVMAASNVEVNDFAKRYRDTVSIECCLGCFKGTRVYILTFGRHGARMGFRIWNDTSLGSIFDPDSFDATEQEYLELANGGLDFVRRGESYTWRMMQDEIFKHQSGIHSMPPLRFVHIKQWLRACTTIHMACKLVRDEAMAYGLPKRLLDISNLDGSVKIVETTERFTSETGLPVYATLSYCWGRDPFLTLVGSNYERFTTKGVCVAELGRTIQDAICLCQILGIKFMWIDCLCIIQDSPDDEDWKIESQKMHHVYGGSILNIAATASHQVSGGLFRPRNDIPEAKIHFKLPQGWSCIEDPLYRYDLLGQGSQRLGLLKRGWVQQELHLSAANLHFTECQMLWQCKSGTVSDGIQTFEKCPLLGGSVSVTKTTEPCMLMVCWKSIASKYAATSVTMARDRYIALASLAAKFKDCFLAQNFETDYIAGCWSSNILDWITWQVEAIDQSYEDTSPLHTYIPSWSWLRAVTLVSFRETIGNSGLLGQSYKEYATAKGPIAHHENALHTYAELSWACLELEGPVLKIHRNCLSRDNNTRVREYSFTSESNENIFLTAEENLSTSSLKVLETYDIPTHPNYTNFDISLPQCLLIDMDENAERVTFRILLIRPSEDFDEYHERFGAIRITLHRSRPNFDDHFTFFKDSDVKFTRQSFKLV